MLPPGPKQPQLVQAYRYAFHFPELTREQHELHGHSWTLRLPGLPPSIVTTDRELIRDLLTGDPLRKRHANDILAPALGEQSVLLLEPEPHLARRKLLLPPFHGERIQGYAELMRSLVQEDLDAWPADGEVRVHDHARRLTLQVIQQAVLGSRDPDFGRRLAGLLDTFASPLANFGLFAPALTKRSRWNVLAEPIYRQRDKLDALMDEQIARKRADPGDDVLSMLIATDLGDDALNDELKTLLAAGHETTATAIGWAADLLAHRPEAVARLREEGPAAAVKEVLRMRTITPVSVARTRLEDDTVVLIDAHTLHRDPELHPHPDDFRPERFDEELEPYSYLPFGGGAHRCVGSALATLELEIAIEAITDRFDLSPAGPPATPVRRGPTLIPSGGAAVKVRRR